MNQQVRAITKDLVSRYDTEGLRAEIEENEKLTKFIFHKENILVETDKHYNSISRFVRGYEVVAADISNEELESEENRYYYTQDEHGSTIFITDKNQRVRNEYYYDAFGNVLDGKEEVHNRITYAGQQFDGITGQYYLRARFYNPVIGRFTQEDTYRGDGLNLYAYCGNNPVGYYDPSGYSSINKERPSALPETQLLRGSEWNDYFKQTYGAENVTWEGTETLYRTMSESDYNVLSKTGNVRYTKETFTSTSQAYSAKYDGTLVEFKLNKGTINSLEDIGARETNNPYLRNLYPEMPEIKDVKNWRANNAYFKREGEVLNIGLGQKRKALDIFNNNIIHFEVK